MRRDSKIADFAYRCQIGLLLAFVGLFLGVVGGVMFVTMPKEYGKTEAVIVDIDSYYDADGSWTGDVYISYDVDGVHYENINMGEYSSTYYVGKKITIMYDKNDPTRIVSAGSKKWAYVLVGIGAFLFALGLVDVVSAVARTKNSGNGFVTNVLLQGRRRDSDWHMPRQYENAPKPQDEHEKSSEPFEELPSDDSIYTYTSTSDRKKKNKKDRGLVDDPFGKE